MVFGEVDPNADLDLVIMTVTRRVVAFAKYLGVLLGRQVGDVEPVSRCELIPLAEEDFVRSIHVRLQAECG